MAEGVAWMGRGCGGGALEQLQVVKYENQRPNFLPVDVCMYNVAISHGIGRIDIPAKMAQLAKSLLHE